MAPSTPDPQVNLQWALAYAAAGLPIFPVHSCDTQGRCSCERPSCVVGGADEKQVAKHPMTPAGLLDASVEPTRITRWWTSDAWGSGRANIGLNCGAAGLVVADLDTHDGTPIDARLQQFLTFLGAPLPAGPYARTGGGGYHYYFRPPPGVEVPPGVGVYGPGIDVRGQGSYVLLPPSNHVSGGRYAWVTHLLELTDG